MSPSVSLDAAWQYTPNLQRSEKITVGGRYKVTLKLWIGPSGAVERLQAVDASGDPRSDQAVVEVVSRVVVRPPPPEGLPQPVVLVVRSRPGA